MVESSECVTDSTSHIEDDLARLLVGADASKIWGNINRVCEAVADKLNSLQGPENQITEEISNLQNRLSEAESIKPESNSIRLRLKQMTGRIGWKSTVENQENFATSLLEPLAELVAIAQQASALNWVVSPISLDGLDKYCQETTATIDRTTEEIDRLVELRTVQQKLSDLIERDRNAMSLARQAKRLAELGVNARVEQKNKWQNEVNTYSAMLSGLDPEVIAPLYGVAADIEVASYYSTLASSRSAADALLNDRKQEFTKFKKLSDQSLNLMQELREVAGRILQNTSDPDQCPLCHTQFKPGELAIHMNLGVDERLEGAARKLLTQVREKETVLAVAANLEKASFWLKEFCGRAKLKDNVSLGTALKELENVKQYVQKAFARLKVLDGELAALREQGFSAEQLEEVHSQLRPLGYRLADNSEQALDLLLSTADQNLKNSIQALESGSRRWKELEHRLRIDLGLTQGGIHSFQAAL
jgi:DNA repair protein SbcC/Rad50